MRRRLAVSVFLLLAMGGVTLAQSCSVRCYFVTPEVDGVVETAIISAINRAQKTLDIALFSFTDDQLGNAVVQAHRRGASVRVLLAEGQDRVLGGEHGKLVSAGVSVAMAQGLGYFHHSFAVIDGELVITGSYDWSDAADQHNYENAVFISCPLSTTAQTVPAQYAGEFARLWAAFRGGSAASTSQAAESFAAITIIIDEVDPIGECVQLLNISTRTIDIEGWAISDLEGVYIFPPETLLHPDEPFRICGDTYNPTHNIQGLDLNDVHDELFLSSPQGKIVDEVVW